MSPVKILFCYAHEDEAYVDKLKAQLITWQRKGLIEVWYNQDITPGEVWKTEIKKQLEIANIILLLVSPDFMKSDYCYTVEMQQALERHKRREAIVIPVILRSIDWKETPLGELQALPKDGKPILRKSGDAEDNAYLDNAFFNVAEGVRKAIKDMSRTVPPAEPPGYLPPGPPESPRRKPLMVLGSVVGFTLTAVGVLVLFVVIADLSSPFSVGFYETGFSIAVILTCVGTFLFCKSTTATIGRYSAAFSLMIAVLVFVTSFFQPNQTAIMGNLVGSGIITLLAGTFFWTTRTKK
jgi:TIR domain